MFLTSLCQKVTHCKPLFSPMRLHTQKRSDNYLPYIITHQTKKSNTNLKKLKKYFLEYNDKALKR